MISDEWIAASEWGIEHLLHPPFSKSSESDTKSANMNSKSDTNQQI